MTCFISLGEKDDEARETRLLAADQAPREGGVGVKMAGFGIIVGGRAASATSDHVSDYITLSYLIICNALECSLQMFGASFLVR